MCVLLAVAQIITSAEILAIRREYSPRGAFPWRVLRLEPGRQSRISAVRSAVDLTMSERGVSVVSLVRICAATAIAVTPPYSASFSVASCVLVTAILLYNYRQTYGGDGADQMSLQVGLAVLVGFGVWSSTVMSLAAVLFVAAQASLSYLVSGIAKAVSVTWRSGRALPLILSTVSYGHPTMSAALTRRPLLARAVAWATILGECAFPLVLIVPMPLSWALVVAAGLFHLVAAWAMGLNVFPWAFAATYPAILFTNGLIQ